MRYLLDTDTCSFAIRGTHGVREHLASLNGADLALSTVTLAEAWTGCRKARNKEQWLAAWRHLVSPWAVLDFERICADAYSKIRTHLERRGAMIGGNDCLIAATAVANELTLVTHNTEEFRRVPKLRVEDWAETE